MEILVVDDEPLARQRLARMIDKIAGCSCVAVAANADEAWAAVATHDPDLILLDIRMPGEDGLSFAARLVSLEEAPAVVFCTAFSEHAVQAFSTDAVGYLLKPVRLAQLEDVIAKAQRLNKVQRALLTTNDNDTGNRAPPEQLTIRSRGGLKLVPLEAIRLFSADQKYVTVYHTEGEDLIDESLKELAQLFGDRLLRIHRNALVSLPHVEALERTPQGQFRIQLKNLAIKPLVSRRHAADVRRCLEMKTLMR